VLNVAVPEIVLNEPGVCALVGEGKAAGMTQHVGMHRNGQPSLLAVLAQGEVDGRAVQWLALLTEEERPPQRHPGPACCPLAGGGRQHVKGQTWREATLPATLC
jgi:hypothetical protein